MQGGTYGFLLATLFFLGHDGFEIGHEHRHFGLQYLIGSRLDVRLQILLALLDGAQCLLPLSVVVPPSAIGLSEVFKQLISIIPKRRGGHRSNSLLRRD